MIGLNSFTGPDPPRWREWTPVVYLKDKLYYLSGKDYEINVDTDRVDVRRTNGSSRNNLFRF